MCCRWISLLVLIVLFSCSSQNEIPIPGDISVLENLSVFPADSEPEFTISLGRETVYGDTEEVLLGSWLSAAVDDLGRVFIADQQETVLHLYNSDGTYNRQIEQEGEGPGEYRNIAAMRIDNEYLHLMDRNLNRITRYHLDTFEVAGDVSVSMERGSTDGPFLYPATFFVQNDSTYLLQTGMAFSPGQSDDLERTIEGRMMNMISGEMTDSTVFSFPDSEMLVHRDNNAMMAMTVPYNRKSILYARNGQLVYGWSEDFLFKIFNGDGDWEYERAIYYPYQNLSLERDEILAIYADREEQWQNIVRNADMPETMPVFDSFIADDEGRIWVKKLTEDRDEAEYVILANSGELLATFIWPDDRQIQEVKDGFLYSHEINEETGLREIVKYRISFGEG